MPVLGLLAVLAIVGPTALEASVTTDQTTDREAAVTAEADALWAAAGIPPDVPGTPGLQSVLRRGASGCDQVADEDRHWFTTLRSVVVSGHVSQEVLLDAVTPWLAGRGYVVERYRDDFGNALVDAVDLTRDYWMTLTVDTEGWASLRLRLSPCTRGDVAPPDPAVWRPGA